MIASVDTMLETWRKYEGKEIDVGEQFRFLTSDVISRTAFGSSYLEGRKVFETLTKLCVIISRNAHKIRYFGIEYATSLYFLLSYKRIFVQFYC